MKTRTNYNVFIFVLLFFIMSFISIYSTLIYSSPSLGNLALKQSVWFVIGVLTIFIIVRLKNNFLFNNAEIIYGIILFSLLLLLIIGIPINNSKCWFIIPGVGSIQPSEFMKIAIMLLLGKSIYIYRRKSIHNGFEEFLLIAKGIMIVALPSVLTFLQPDTGAVIIYLVIFAFMMIFSGIRMRWFLFALLLLFVIISICGGIYFFNEVFFVKIFGTSMYYRIERLFMWKDGIGLQLENALATIGSSGLFGHGFNHIPIYFPESSTDFIFAAYASNFGFIGVVFSFLVFILFDLYILSIIKRKNNSIDKYVLVGTLGMLIFQQLQNIGMTVGLFPITGITLPYISYGGSSLISYMIIIGLIVNSVSERNKKYI